MNGGNLAMVSWFLLITTGDILLKVSFSHLMHAEGEAGISASSLSFLTLAICSLERVLSWPEI